MGSLTHDLILELVSRDTRAALRASSSDSLQIAVVETALRPAASPVPGPDHNLALLQVT